MTLRTRRLASLNGPRVGCLIAGLAACLGFKLQAWEGHEWSQWRQVATWQKPALPTDQAGRRDRILVAEAFDIDARALGHGQSAFMLPRCMTGVHLSYSFFR